MGKAWGQGVSLQDMVDRIKEIPHYHQIQSDFKQVISYSEEKNISQHIIEK